MKLSSSSKQSRQAEAATQVSLTQLEAGGLPIRKRRKYRKHKKGLITIKEKYEMGECTLTELLKAYSH